MSAKLIENLRKVEIFNGLNNNELLQVAEICKALKAPSGRTIFNEGDEGDSLYIILEGCVRVMITTRQADGSTGLSTINTLYEGQCFGEMVLLNGSTRSATIATVEPTTLLVIGEPDFRSLCETHPRIGYCVIRNLAQDLAYKLRSSNLLLRGNIRWRGGELGRTA